MSDPTILFVKPGAVKASDKNRLFKAGVIVVEVEHPSDVKLVTANRELSHGAILGAAATAIAGDSNGYVKLAFATALAKAIMASETPR